MLPTFDQGVSAAGVTWIQCPPPSAVRQTSPSSVPTQMMSALNGDCAMV